jgi:hypothetical protein
MDWCEDIKRYRSAVVESERRTGLKDFSKQEEQRRAIEELTLVVGRGMGEIDRLHITTPWGNGAK